ncbi:hypothetical protein M436DRAFT_80120 [Aureobasidium namibiae CBS 147.97]|uniref:Uncharacterized protein n=1 Tax=Aureobasidium namibiae CBS 147.97 TaxID=1043004 RepID=A0A074WW35_9PEZI
MFTKTSDPYITAVLTSSHSILDLSGKQPFTLLITLTLHASAPILCYTSPHSTFFLPRNALTDMGIIFRNHHTKDEIKTCHIDSCKTPGFARRLDSKTKLVLIPEEPVVYEVPFTINSDKQRDAEDFDPWFASITSGFGDGGVYEAELPLYRTIDWWRYARACDLHDTQSTESTTIASSSIPARFGSVVDSVMRWWKGDIDTETKYGVPVLPHNQQLPVYTEGEGLLFSCVGENMVWPDELLEKQRINKERRDGEERRKAEQKRRDGHARE